MLIILASISVFLLLTSICFYMMYRKCAEYATQKVYEVDKFRKLSRQNHGGLEGAALGDSQCLCGVRNKRQEALRRGTPGVERGQ